MFRKRVFLYLSSTAISGFVCSWLLVQELVLPALLIAAILTCVLFYMIRPAILQQRFMSIYPGKQISKTNLLIIYFVPPLFFSVLLLFCIKKKYQWENLVPVFRQERSGIILASALMIIGLHQSASPWLHFPVQSYVTEVYRNFFSPLQNNPKVRYSTTWKKLFKIQKVATSIILEKRLERNPAQKKSDMYGKKLVSGVLSVLEENPESFETFTYSPLQWMTPSSMLQILSVILSEKVSDGRMRAASLKKMDGLLAAMKREDSKVDAELQELYQRLHVQKGRTHQL